MEYKYTHFIPQNAAPKGAKSIGVYKDGVKVASIPLGGLTPPSKDKLYSFGLFSDVHLDKAAFNVAWKSATKLENALSYFKTQGCEFAVHCGDLINQGFFHKNSAGEVWQDETEFLKYDEIRKKCGITIYGLCGNHENYGRNITDTTPVTIAGVSKTMLEWLYDLTTEDGTTGTAKLSYTIERENDLFVFVGQPRNVIPLCGPDGEENMEWLTGILTANKDKRCFLFVHSYIEGDSGDPMDKRENSLFDTSHWSTTQTNAFKDLLRQHPNLILFHGHSHMKFECQELDECANYTEVNGFKSVHIPSLGRPRNIDLNTTDTTKDTPESDAESQGYIVDVYDDCIVLNGMDLINNIPVSLGCYRIEMSKTN